MRRSGTGGRRCNQPVSTCRRCRPRRGRVRALSESLYRALQPKTARANLRRIDLPPCSYYSVMEVAIPKNNFEKHYSEIDLGKGKGYVRLSARGTCDGLRAEQLRNTPIGRCARIRTRRAAGK